MYFSSMWLVPAIITVVSVGFALTFVVRLMKQRSERRRLLLTGVPAQGQVVTIQQTGTFVNNNPEVLIVLKIAPPSGQPYVAQARLVIQLIQAAQLAPGATVPVRIDPANPANVTLAM